MIKLPLRFAEMFFFVLALCALQSQCLAAGVPRQANPSWAIARELRPAVPTSQCAFTSNTRVVFQVGRNLEEWDVVSGNRVHSHELPAAIERATFSFTGNQLAYVADGRIQFWDRTTGQNVPRDGFTNARFLAGTGAVLSRDGRKVATAHANGGFAIWEVATGRELARLPMTIPADTPVKIQFSPDGDTLVLAIRDRISFWDLQYRRTRDLTVPVTSPVNVLSFSPNGHHLLVVSNIETVVVETFPKTLLRWDRRPFPVILSDATFSADGRRIGVVVSDYGLYLSGYNPRSDEPMPLSFNVDSPGVQPMVGLCYSPDNTRVAITMSNGPVRIYDTSTIPQGSDRQIVTQRTRQEHWDGLGELGPTGQSSLAGLMRENDDVVGLIREKLDEESRRYRLTPMANARIAPALRELGERSYRTRELATGELLRGLRAELNLRTSESVHELLQTTLEDPDTEIARRARQIMAAGEDFYYFSNLRMVRALQILETFVRETNSAPAMALIRHLSRNENPHPVQKRMAAASLRSVTAGAR